MGEIFLPLQNEYVGGQTPYPEEGEGEGLNVEYKRAEEEHSHSQEPLVRTDYFVPCCFELSSLWFSNINQPS